MPRIIRWSGDEPLPSPAVAFAPDEDADPNFLTRCVAVGVLAVAASLSILGVAWSYEDLPRISIDEETWSPQYAQREPARVLDLRDDEVPAGSLHGPPEDDAWILSRARRDDVRLFDQWREDDLPTFPVGFAPDEDYWLQLRTVQLQQVTPLALWLPSTWEDLPLVGVPSVVQQIIVTLTQVWSLDVLLTQFMPIDISQSETGTAVAQPVAAIHGIVVNDDTGAPLSGVLVIVGTGPSAITGADGSFLVVGIVPGAYVVTISRSGYVSLVVNV